MQMEEGIRAFPLPRIACGKNSNTAVQFFKSSTAILKKTPSTFTAYSPLADNAVAVNVQSFFFF